MRTLNATQAHKPDEKMPTKMPVSLALLSISATAGARRSDPARILLIGATPKSMTALTFRIMSAVREMAGDGNAGKQGKTPGFLQDVGSFS